MPPSDWIFVMAAIKKPRSTAKTPLAIGHKEFERRDAERHDVWELLDDLRPRIDDAGVEGIVDAGALGRHVHALLEVVQRRHRARVDGEVDEGGDATARGADGAGDIVFVLGDGGAVTLALLS